MAYNFSNTYKQPLEKFSMPEGGGGITGLLSGLTSGYSAGKNMKARNKENKTFKEDFMAMIGTEPAQEEIDMNLRSRGIRPGNFISDFTGAALGAEGVGKMAKNPLLREQVQNIQLGNQRQQQENTLFDQLTRDAGGMVQDFSNLSTTEQRLNFLKNNAGKTLTREGAALMGQFAQITQQLAVLENKSEAAILAHKDRLDKADLIAYGYDPRDPESLAPARKNQSAFELHKMLKEMGAPLDEPIPSELFLPNGSLNYQMALPYVGNIAQKFKYKTREKESAGSIAADEIINAQNELTAARQSGDLATASKLEQKLQLLKDAFPTRGSEEVTMRMDDQGRPIFQMIKGGKSGGVGPTVGTETELQKNISAARRTAEDLAALQGQLRPEDVGIRGAIGEQLIDRVVAQFAPELQNDKRTENRTKLRASIEGMVRRVNSDTRFSNADRKAAGEVLPSAGWQDSHPRIVKSLQTLQGIFARRAVADAKAAKMPIEPWMVSPLMDEDIITLNKDGIITKEEALQMYNLKNPPR